MGGGLESKTCANQAGILVSLGLAGCRGPLPGDELYSTVCLWLPDPGVLCAEPCAAVAAGLPLLFGAAPCQGSCTACRDSVTGNTAANAIQFLPE